MAKQKPSVNRPPAQQPARVWSSREAYLLAAICLLCGLVAGYLFRGSASPVSALAGTATPAAPASEAASQPASVVAAKGASLDVVESLRPLAAPLLKALELDPKNWNTLVQLGNLYYDHQVYPEAIRYYQRALEIRPDDVNVRTDLGTALWYSGFPEKAVEEYQKALAIQDHHPQTLFNLGIVKLEGLNDPAGAIVAWQKLLEKNPQYQEKEKVLGLIEQAKQRKKARP